MCMKITDYKTQITKNIQSQNINKSKRTLRFVILSLGIGNYLKFIICDLEFQLVRPQGFEPRTA